ncbi:Bcr/CflA family efflux MFS transporter [Amnibacterium setariae]|uniref:Bcr/CflA family efflux MFS transporter n=1 Tax=Amnibacterium setariae TaxID=2306585 RepID=A0A3A1TXC4_9MICO|nr:Bcr/CflA family efflux MFS transporter [Amnibacterium setariae]RIX28420.1 Bcr/CflA family efflux MFS transporter [Amnibacterium setariae]
MPSSSESSDSAGAASAGGRRLAPSTLALIAVTGTSALATDTYIAALPAMRDSLQTSDTLVQLTLTACIGGLALGQLVVGPISDARGRRRIIVAATIAFTIAGVVCALSTSVVLMIVARLAQGFAAGAGASVGRAVVTDTFEGRRAAAKFGTLTAVSLIGPVAGPAIGGLLLPFGGWRAIFWFLAVVGVLMTVAALAGIPETLPADRRRPGGLRQLLARSGELLRHRPFITPVAVQCLVTCGFFIYIGGSSIVLQTDLRLTPAAYTVVFATDAATMIGGSLLYRAFVMRLGPEVLRRIAFTIASVAVLALLAVALLAAPRVAPLPAVWICLAVMTFGLGGYLPSNSAIAQREGRRYAGTASALSGGLPFLAGALTTPLTGLLGAQTVLVMAIGMSAFFVLAIALAVAGRSRGSGALAEGPADG